MAKGERGTSKPFLRGKIWWIQYAVPGESRERRESSHSTKKPDAIRLLNQRRSEIDKRAISSANVTVADLLENFLVDQRQNHRRSYRSVEGHVRIHLKPAFGKLLAADVTSPMISRFISTKQEAGLENGSINRYLSALRRAFILGRDSLPPLITVVPKFKLLDETDAIREGFLEHDQYLRMRAELPFHQQMLLVIGYHWGMRLGEILSLRWDQIDWDENLLRLEKSQTKGKQGRYAPLYGELRAWLEMAHREGSGSKTIVSYGDQPITEVKTAWDKARVRAKLPDLLRHDLRRTAVRNMIRAGIPQKQAMIISGHKDSNVFDRYDIVDERDIQAAGKMMNVYLSRKAEELKVTTKVTTVGQTIS
jgi:integrase